MEPSEKFYKIKHNLLQRRKRQIVNGTICYRMTDKNCFTSQKHSASSRIEYKCWQSQTLVKHTLKKYITAENQPIQSEAKKNNNGFIQITFLQILSITDGVCFMNNNNNNSLQQSNNIFYTKPWYTNSSINSEKKKNSIG